MPKKGKKIPAEKEEQLRQSYSSSTAANLLDEAFNRLEESVDQNGVPYLDRNDHIIIGGRTASEIMMEKFNTEFPNMKQSGGIPYAEHERTKAYAAFRKEAGKDYINQMISGAMASGEKVEVFVPDKTTGKIKEKPMALTPDGYKTTDPLAKPAQLNGWQKFWGKLGFYKRERAAVRNYEQETAARDRVKFCNKAARANLATNYAQSTAYLEEMKNFRPDIEKDMEKNFPEANGDPAMLGQANGFRTQRSSFYATVIQVLATKRGPDGKLLYTNEQLFGFDRNNHRMWTDRPDAAKEVYEHYKSGALLEKEKQKKREAEKRGEKYEIDPKLVEQAAKDRDWLVDLQRDSADVLQKRIDEQARKLDFSKPDITEQEGYREFALLSDTAFDLSQDMKENDKQMDEKYGKNTYWDYSGKVGAASQLSRQFGTSMNTQKQLINGVYGQDRYRTSAAVADTFYAQGFQQQVGKAMKENPNQSLSGIVDQDLLDSMNNAKDQARYDENLMEEVEAGQAKITGIRKQAMDLLNESLANPKKFSKQVVDGVYERRFQLDEVNPDPEAEDPAKFTIKSASQVERQLKQERQQEERQNSGGPEL